MRIPAALLLAFYVTALGIAQTPKGTQSIKGNSTGSHEVITSKVEAVFRVADEQGFQFNAYQINFKGHSVIVDDPICSTNANVGDEIRVIVVRNDLSKPPTGGKKVLAFIVAKPKA